MLSDKQPARKVFSAVSIFFFLGLSACAAQQGKPLADITFQHIQPLTVNVRTVDTDVRPGSTVDNFFMAPSDAAERYFRAQFLAQGLQGSLRGIVEEASVTGRYEPAQNSVANYIDVGGHDVFDVKVKIRLEHVSDLGNVLYGKVIAGRRVMKISEHASIAEREKHQMEGLEALFADIDRQVTKTVTEEMHLAGRK